MQVNTNQPDRKRNLHDYLKYFQKHPNLFQFGIEYDTNIDILKEADLFIQDHIYTYLIGIKSNDAYGLGFNFSNFYLTPNAELYFYDKERTDFLGSLLAIFR